MATNILKKTMSANDSSICISVAGFDAGSIGDSILYCILFSRSL